MPIQEIVPPQIQIPVMNGIIESGSQIDILIKLPGMNGSDHGRNGMSVSQMNAITQVFVVGKRIACSPINHPSRVCTPEQVAIN